MESEFKPYRAIKTLTASLSVFVDKDGYEEGWDDHFDQTDWNFESYNVVRVDEDQEIQEYLDFEGQDIKRIQAEVDRLNAEEAKKHEN